MAEKDLGYRRVQCTGRGSYIICLPKEWVHTLGLDRGSEIAFNLQPDQSLTLVPRKIREKNEDEEGTKLKEYYISVDPEEDLQSTLRLIQALYVISADIMRIHFKGTINATKCKTEIKNFAKDTFLGSEVIDETDSEVTLQILVRHPKFPQYIRRFAESHDVVLRRLRGAGKLGCDITQSIITTSPPPLLPKCRLYDFYENPKTRNLDSKVYRWSMLDNNYLSKQYKQEILATHHGSLAKRFIDGLFVPKRKKRSSTYLCLNLLKGRKG